MSKNDILNVSNNEKIFNKDDFVYFKGGNGIESSGYTINSILMNERSPVMITNNTDSSVSSQSGGKVSNLLNNFAVPAGLLLLQQKPLKHYEPINNKDEIVNDSLFDKLLQLSTPVKDKKNTKRNKNKNKKNNNRKTKRKN